MRRRKPWILWLKSKLAIVLPFYSPTRNRRTRVVRILR
jgi:hypothetical protein